MAKKREIQASPLTENQFLKSKIWCYALPFIYFFGVLVWNIVQGDIRSVNGYYLIHLFYNYDRGFVARGLVGEVISWFADTVSDEMTRQIMIIFDAILAFCGSLYIGKTLSLVRKDKEKLQCIVFIVLMFFVFAGPLNYYYVDFKLDKLLWALSFLAVFLMNYRFGVYLVPVICVIATLINPVFLLCSMILVSIILLQKFHESSYRAANGIVCAVAYLTMIAIGLYAPISEKKLGFNSGREVIDFYFSRYSGTLDETAERLFETEWLVDYYEPAETWIRFAFEKYFIELNNGFKALLAFILMALPAFVLFVGIWKKAIRNEENKMQKFIYFLCAIAPVVLIPTVVISWEFTKYFYNYLLVQVGLIMYFITNKTPSFCITVQKLTEYCREHIAVALGVIAYFATYMAVFRCM